MQQFNPRTATLEGLADWMGQAQPGSLDHTRGMAELILRQIQTQIEATKAQIAAAVAEEKAANAAAKNTRYVFWSVIFAASSAFISLVATILTYWPRA